MDRRMLLAAASATGVLLACGARAQTPTAGPSRDDWRIAPRRGLGRLTFGMTQDEAGALRAIYGEPGRIVRQDASADLESVIASQNLGASLPPAELALLRRLAAEASRMSTQVLQGAGSTALDYRDGRLESIMVKPGSGPIAFGETRIFDIGARDALVLFETANGGPGRYRSTEAAFDALAISLDGFCDAATPGGVRLLSVGNAAFAARSVTLRQTPYRPEHEMAQFVTRSFL